jgi:FkbM family methyltransferase
MEQLLPFAKTVFDAGAYVGEWASHALRINPNIEIHCFEPHNESFVRLQENEVGENVICNRCGLGVKNGYEVLYVAEGMGEGHSLYRRQGLEEIIGGEIRYGTEQVNIITLDSYCEEKSIQQIDFLKIDVEGNEFAVIEGGRNTFEREAVKVTQFEYGGTYIDSRVLLKDFYDFFVGMNYSFFLLYPNSVRPVLRYDQRLENFQYKNFLIVNNNETLKKPFRLP